MVTILKFHDDTDVKFHDGLLFELHEAVSSGPSGGRSRHKGRSLLEQPGQTDSGGKKLFRVEAKFVVTSKFKKPQEKHFRVESRFKRQVAVKVEAFARCYKMFIGSPSMEARFKKRAAVRLETYAGFKMLQKAKMEIASKFDYTHLIEKVERFLDFLEETEQSRVRFEINEPWYYWEQDREPSFDEPSTVVGKVTYSPDLQTLEVELNGKVYNYCGVPARVFSAFKGAGSKGAFYNREIKNVYLC